MIAGIQDRVEKYVLSKSPTGLMKVIFAGCTTSVSAVCFTFPVIAAIGRATMNTAEPSTVPTK